MLWILLMACALFGCIGIYILTSSEVDGPEDMKEVASLPKEAMLKMNLEQAALMEQVLDLIIPRAQQAEEDWSRFALADLPKRPIRLVYFDGILIGKIVYMVPSFQPDKTRPPQVQVIFNPIDEMPLPEYLEMMKGGNNSTSCAVTST